jgi:hypothetical protein
MKNYKLDSQNPGAQWDDLDRLSQMQSDWARQGEADRLRSQWLLSKEQEEDAALSRLFASIRPVAHLELCNALIRFWKRAGGSSTSKRLAELAFAIAYRWIKSNGGLSRADAERVGERLAAGANPWPEIYAAMLEIPMLDRRREPKGGSRGRRSLDAATAAIGCVFSFVDKWLSNRPSEETRRRGEWIPKMVRVSGGVMARPQRHTDEGEWFFFDETSSRSTDVPLGPRAPCPSATRSATRKTRRR